MSVLAIATAVVIGSFWTLEQLDVLPAGRFQTWVARPALVVIMVAMFAVPAAYQAGMDWFIERQIDQMLELIQPIIDDLAPSPEPGDE